MGNYSSKRHILAGFTNAHRLALQLSENTDIDLGVTRTGNPLQPYRVTRSNPGNPEQILTVQKG